MSAPRTPRLDELGRLPRERRGAFALQHAAEIARERRALVLANVPRAEDERAKFVEERVRALEAHWTAARMANWREQAEREAAARFDGAPVAEEPQPKRRRTTA